MKFLIDAPLPPIFGQAFEKAGFPAKHLRDLDLRQASDGVIWAYAAHRHFNIATKDRDFAERTERETTGPGVIWLRVGNASNAELLKRVIPLLPEISGRLNAAIG